MYINYNTLYKKNQITISIPLFKLFLSSNLFNSSITVEVSLVNSIFFAKQ